MLNTRGHGLLNSAFVASLVMFVSLACMGQALAATPVPSSTNTPTPSPSPTPRLTAYDLSLRAQTGASVRWRPSIYGNWFALSCSIIQPPSHGTATCAVISVSQPSFFGTYAPTAGFVGPDSFTYQLTDSLLGDITRVATVSVDVVAP